MAKARLRRGIELVKLSNRIAALKIQEDDPENPDFNDDPAVASKDANDPQPSNSEASTGGKGRLSRAVKGAIFREIVLAKVREMREQEQTERVREEAEKEAKRKSFNAS